MSDNYDLNTNISEQNLDIFESNVEHKKKSDKKKTKNKDKNKLIIDMSINQIIEDKIIKNNKEQKNFIGIEQINSDLSSFDIDNDDEKNDNNENKYLELEKINKEKNTNTNTNTNLSSTPKNHGNLWSDDERNKILKLLKKHDFDKNCGMFDETNITEIATKLERTSYAVKQEIKKMIYNDFIEGLSYDKISTNFNIPKSNIKLILKLYLEKKSKKITEQFNNENELLRLKIENIKLKKELQEIINFDK